MSSIESATVAMASTLMGSSAVQRSNTKTSWVDGRKAAGVGIPSQRQSPTSRWSPSWPTRYRLPSATSTEPATGAATRTPVVLMVGSASRSGGGRSAAGLQPGDGHHREQATRHGEPQRRQQAARP